MNSHNILLVTEAEIFDAKTKKLKRVYQPKAPENAEALITITQEDANGNVKKRHEQYSKSFVSNFARILNHCFMNVANNTGGSTPNKVKRTVTGGATFITTSAFKMDVLEAALTASAQTAYGIWIGDSDNSSNLGLTLESGVSQSIEAFEDYMLKGLILADGGSPDTNVVYGNTTLTLSGNTITIARRFTNNNPTSISINEVGIIAKVPTTEYIMLSRDITIDEELGTGLEVAAGDVVKVEFTYSISDASGFTSNYLKMISSLLVAGSALSNPVDKLGNSYAVDFSSARTQADLVAAAAGVLNGILIGGYRDSLYQDDDPLPLSVNSYKLTLAQLLEADLAHSAMTAVALTQVPAIGSLDPFTPGYTQIGVYRDFENTLTESVHVQETALYIKELAGSHYYMITRGIFNPRIIVEPEEILRISKYFRFLLADAPSNPHF